MDKLKHISIGLICFIFFIWMGGVTYGAEVRGITSDSIRIGFSLPLTKVLAREGRQSLAASNAYINYINDLGGINGRKIVLIVDDSQLDPGIALGIWKKQVTNDKIFAHFLWGTPPATVLMKPAMEDQVPLLISGIAKSLYTPFRKYVFCFHSPYEAQTATCTYYIHDVLKKKDAKIAILWRNDEYGKTVLNGGRIGASYYNYKIVAEPSYILGQALDFTAEVMKIKQAKADFVLLGAEPGAVASFLREAKNQSLNATIIAGFSPISERKIISMAGDAAENYIAPHTTAMFKETNIPGLKKMLEISKKYAPADILAEESFFYLVHWHFFAMMIEGLKRAGTNPTPDSFVQGLESVKGFTAEGIGYPITFTPERHYSNPVLYFGKVDMKTKDFERVTDWLTTPQDLFEQSIK